MNHLVTLVCKVRSIIIHYTHASVVIPFLRASHNIDLDVRSLRFAWSPRCDSRLWYVLLLHTLLRQDLGNFRRFQKTTLFNLACLLELETSHLDLILHNSTTSLCAIVSDLTELLVSVV